MAGGWFTGVFKNLLKNRNFQNKLCRNSFYTLEPFHPRPGTSPEMKTADQAVEIIKSHDKIWVHGATCTPTPLLNALAKHGRHAGLRNVEVLHILTEGEYELVKPEYKDMFRINALFLDKSTRFAVSEGRADFIPIFLSDIHLLFERNLVTLDVAFIQVSSPDEHGFCTLGPAVECTRTAIVYARAIIALVNPKLPRTFGDAVIHISHIDYLVQTDMDLPERSSPGVTPAQKQIASLIAEELIPDGATLQLGIGAVPQAVGKELTGHKDLGIHSEMFSDEIVDLVDRGCITNAKKAVAAGQITVSFVMGTKKLFNFINDNPFCVMGELRFVNDIKNIARNPKVTAVNTCLEVDLTGQICADSLGSYMYSGVGGQVDFMRGAALGLDGLGKPIIATESITKNGESKIVPLLKKGAGVVTTRAHVHYVVTEYGIAFLFGKTLLERAHALINVAHPQHREMLEKAAFERFKCMPSSL